MSVLQKFLMIILLLSITGLVVGLVLNNEKIVFSALGGVAISYFALFSGAVTPIRNKHND